MKEIRFLGTSLDDIRQFEPQVRQNIGLQLFRVQNGKEPNDYKPMPTIGSGVSEIRIRDKKGAYRVIYVAKFIDYIYVLSAFNKKTQKTPQSVIKLAKQHYKELINEQRK